MIATGDTQSPYLVLLPTNYDPNRPYPMVFLLHGGKQTLGNFPNITRDVAAALSDRAILVYPKSVVPYWENAARQHLQMIKDIKKWSEDQYCVDTRKFIIGGFSSGANFAAAVTCAMPDQIAGTVMASGDYLARSCPQTKKVPMPALVIIGQLDTSHLDGSNQLAEYFRQGDGCMPTKVASTIAPCVEYEACPPALPVIYCLHPAEHDWPRAFGGRAIADLLSRI